VIGVRQHAAARMRYLDHELDDVLERGLRGIMLRRRAAPGPCRPVGPDLQVSLGLELDAAILCEQVTNALTRGATSSWRRRLRTGVARFPPGRMGRGISRKLQTHHGDLREEVSDRAVDPPHGTARVDNHPLFVVSIALSVIHPGAALSRLVTVPGLEIDARLRSTIRPFVSSLARKRCPPAERVGKWRVRAVTLTSRNADRLHPTGRLERRGSIAPDLVLTVSIGHARGRTSYGAIWSFCCDFALLPWIRIHNASLADAAQLFGEEC